MTVDGEEYFPRGGVPREIKKKRNFVFETKSLSEVKKKPGKRERKRKALESGLLEDVEEEPTFERFEPLKYQSLSVGTVALCSVRGIYEKYVDISLPGRLSGRLYIEDVSEPFRKTIGKKGVDSSEELEEANDLKKVFRVGQHLTCSVMSVVQKGHYTVRLSSSPEVVNKERTFESVQIGSLIQLAVESKEDHGYMMYSGIPGLITFLPAANASTFIKDVNNSKPLCLGQIVWGVVTKNKLTGSSNTIQVTLDYDQISESKLEEDVTMDKLVPGTRVEVGIIKTVAQTLLVEVKGSGGMNGYVEEGHLGSPWSQLSDYKPGSKHSAVVLFKFPYARVIALTLKSSPTSISKEEIKNGTVIRSAQVVSILKRGVCLKLDYEGKGYKGQISVRRLEGNVDYESLSSRFPVGNHVDCRIIGFDSLEQVYSCTTEDKLMKEKFLSLSDLKVGQLVDVTVDGLKKSGVTVALGTLKGYVPTEHLSDVILQNPFQKVPLNSKQKAKVLRIKDGKLYLTMRPTLLKNRSLTSFADVKVGEAYYGWVNKICDATVGISFFGDLYTFITHDNLVEFPSRYTIGELVKCYVASKGKGRPVFSLIRHVQGMGLNVGDTFDTIVKEVSPQGLKLVFLSNEQTFNGFLPLEHLSDYLQLCPEEMEKYSVGSKIPNTLLYNLNDRIPLFTLRRSVYNFFQEHENLSEALLLRRRPLLPCSVSSVHEDKIQVFVPIPGYTGNVTITSKYLPVDASLYSKYQQFIAHVAVVKKVKNTLNIVLSGILSEEEKLQWSLSNISNHLNNLKMKQKYRTGSTVECEVKGGGGGKGYREVVLPGGTKGLLLGSSPVKGKKGKSVKALVLFHDVSADVVYLYVSSSQLSLGSPLEKSLEGREVEGTVLCSDGYLRTALIETGGPALAFLPVITTPNKPPVSLFSVASFTHHPIVLRQQKYDEENKCYYWLGYLSGNFDIPCQKEIPKQNIDSEDDSELPKNIDNAESQQSQKVFDLREKLKHLPKLESNDSQEENSAEQASEVPIGKVLSSRDLRVKLLSKRKTDEGTVEDSDQPEVGDSPKNKKSKKESFDSVLPSSQSIVLEDTKPQKKKNKRKIDESLENDTQVELDASLADGEKSSDASQKKKNKKQKNPSNPPEVNVDSNVTTVTNTPESRSKEKKSKKEKKEFVSPAEKKNKKIKTDEETASLDVQESKPKKKKSNKVGGDEAESLLEQAGGFEWDASLSDLSKAVGPHDNQEDMSQDELEEEKEGERKLTTAEKRVLAEEREKRIREKEEELLLAESKPESPEHFDRLLTAAPNSSKLWIMYMAHYMQATEIEKARSIARRALKHINVRLEDERLNVWIASLNLENMYGTEDSFQEVLRESLKHNDDYKVYQRVLDIYAESKKLSELEKLVNQMVRKYKEKADCWLECQNALMKSGLYDKARHYLQRSLQALPPKEHCSLISRFALLENKYGFTVQAQSLFENLLTSYPKRTDIWFVYVDMLTKSGSVDLARNVLERATSHKLPLRKIKSLYQKWLKLEETHGSPDAVERVNKAAAAYVARITSNLKDEPVEEE